MENIVIATIKSWNIKRAYEFSEQCRDYIVWTITDKDKLQAVHELNPKYIFFPHWSWKIPKDIYEKYECIAFHMADLPYGRGGSPLQNLILRKIYDTKITAFKVDEGIDTGPVYMKVPFNIANGSAQELYEKASKVISEYMIPHIIANQPKPYTQTGEVLEFSRRTPDMSNLIFARGNGPRSIYDQIRMMDAEGYPKSFVGVNTQQGKIKILLSNVDFSENDYSTTGRFEIVND